MKDLLVSKEEVLKVAEKIKAGPEAGESIVVFYLEEKVFGITSLTALLTLDGHKLGLNKEHNLQMFCKLRAKYGEDQLEVIYLYRGQDEDKMEAMAKQLDMQHRANKIKQKATPNQGKRIRKRKAFDGYELTDESAATDQDVASDAPMKKATASSCKDTSTNKKAKKQTPSVEQLSMLAGFASIADPTGPAPIPVDDSNWGLPLTTQELTDLETKEEKIKRLEKEVYSANEEIGNLRKELRDKAQFSTDVLYHTQMLYNLLAMSPMTFEPKANSLLEEVLSVPPPQATTAFSEPVAAPSNQPLADCQLTHSTRPSSPKPPGEVQPLPSPPQLTNSQQGERSSSQELLPTSAARLKSSFQETPDSTMRALIKDTNNPERFAGVKVNSYNLYQLEQAAKKKDNQIFLVNGIIKLVFTPEELARSSGLGLKSSKIGGEAKPSPLDPIKVQATKEYIRTAAKKFSWAVINEKEINRKFTYQITNARRDLKHSH